MKYDKLALIAAPVIPQYLMKIKLDIPITNSPAKEAEAEIEKLQTQYDKMCVVAVQEPATEPLTPEQIQDLRANGLCPDESKPNKFGCCDGETFKDVGNMEFKCCPNDGGECLPLVVPVKE